MRGTRTIGYRYLPEGFCSELSAPVPALCLDWGRFGRLAALGLVAPKALRFFTIRTICTGSVRGPPLTLSAAVDRPSSAVLLLCSAALLFSTGAADVLLFFSAALLPCCSDRSPRGCCGSCLFAAAAALSLLLVDKSVGKAAVWQLLLAGGRLRLEQLESPLIWRLSAASRKCFRLLRSTVTFPR